MFPSLGFFWILTKSQCYVLSTYKSVNFFSINATEKKKDGNAYSNLAPKISKTLGKCSHSFSCPVASFSYSNIHQYPISKYRPYTPNANLSSFSVYFSSPSVSNSLKLCDSWAVEPSSFWRSLYESFPSASAGAFSNSFWRSAKRTRIEKQLL